MNSATLTCVISSLNLRTKDLGVLFDVSPRTPERWRDGSRTIPESIGRELIALDKAILEHAEATLDLVPDDSDVVLVAYKNEDDLKAHHPDWCEHYQHWRTHTAYLNKLRLLLLEEDQEACIVWFDEELYREFLASGGPESIAAYGGWAKDRQR